MSIADELTLAIDEYLSEIKNRKSAALSAKQQNYNRLAEGEAAGAKQLYEQNSRDAYKSYADYINPYGVQAEAQSAYGIEGSGIAQSNNIRAYSAYQNRLSDAQSEYAQRLTDIGNTLLTNSANLLSEEYGLQAEYLRALMEKYNENYWKEKNFDYKVQRDAIEDERYEREWEYMLAKNAYSSSGRVSSGYSSSSKNSSSSDKESPLNINLPSKGSYDQAITGAVDMMIASVNNPLEGANKLSKEQLDALSKMLKGIRG